MPDMAILQKDEEREMTIPEKGKEGECLYEDR
jgi:hypothetical protein